MVVDVESVVREYLRPAAPAPASDLPPKYEEVQAAPQVCWWSGAGAGGVVLVEWCWCWCGWSGPVLVVMVQCVG